MSVGRGIVTVVHLQETDFTQPPALEIRSQLVDHMEDFLQANHIEAFCEVDMVREQTEGYISVAQANGIAGMQSNTIVMGWSSNLDIVPLMLAMDSLQKSLILTRLNGWNGKRERIDVWWSGTQSNGDLMLLLAYLLRLSKSWRSANIYLKTLIDDESSYNEREQALLKICAETRIQADCEVLVRSNEHSLNQVIVSHSKTADLVLLGMSLPELDKADSFIDWYAQLAEGLDNVMFIRNSSPFRGQLIVDAAEMLD